MKKLDKNTKLIFSLIMAIGIFLMLKFFPIIFLGLFIIFVLTACIYTILE